MQAVSQIPRPALVLGWLGVFPFAAFALLAISGGLLPRGASSSALVLYGVVILSFMGGAQWGLAMAMTRGGDAALGPRLLSSVLPALAAFGVWFAPTGAAPPWYPALRLQLTSAVVICLLLGALAGRPA